MITVKEVQTKRERKQFLDFPLKLYKNNPYYVPILYADEMKIFSPNYEYYDQSEAVYYLAYDEKGTVVGRISGILQLAANKKWNQKRVRFTRFDCIDDQEVADALFNTIEDWAIKKGMKEVVGPLGFSDFEREGLLIDGFDQLNTYEEQYNFPYYQRLIENFGFTKDIDWTEHRLFAPDPETYERIKRISDKALERYHLHIGKAKNTNDFLKKYADDFFELIDITYNDIYGTVPMTGRVRKSLIKAFKLIINVNYVDVILDANDKPVCFGLCFPSIGQALQKTGGKLNGSTVRKVLKQIKHPDGVDLGLIGVLPEYRLKGVATVLFAKVAKHLLDGKIQYAETNLTLETNSNILNQWKSFKAVEHKRRRSFVKTIGNVVQRNPQPNPAQEAAPAAAPQQK